MINYIKRKLERRRIKATSKVYGSEVVKFNLPEIGVIEFVRWLNPLESEKSITQNEVNNFKRIVKQGDFIIDIGAHIGDTTVPMALAVGKEGLTVAFDPNPYVFEILLHNSKLNTDKLTIEPYNYAIMAEDGDYFYNSTDATFNNGGVSDTPVNRHGKYGLQNKIKGINLEKFLKTNYSGKLNKLSLIKIDAEGYDIEIIRSITSIIEEFKPKVIFECFRQLNKNQRYDLYDTVALKGYKLYLWDHLKNTGDMLVINKKNMTDRRHFDVLAIPD